MPAASEHEKDELAAAAAQAFEARGALVVAAVFAAGVDKDLMKDYPQPATPPPVSATMFTPREETAMPTTATLKAADPMPEDERKRLRLPNLFRPGTK